MSVPVAFAKAACMASPPAGPKARPGGIPPGPPGPIAPGPAPPGRMPCGMKPSGRRPPRRTSSSMSLRVMPPGGGASFFGASAFGASRLGASFFGASCAGVSSSPARAPGRAIHGRVTVSTSRTAQARAIARRMDGTLRGSDTQPRSVRGRPATVGGGRREGDHLAWTRRVPAKVAPTRRRAARPWGPRAAARGRCRGCAGACSARRGARPGPWP